MEDTRDYNVQGDHPAKLQVLTCIKLDTIIDQNKKIILYRIDIRKMNELEEVSKLLQKRNEIDSQISKIIGRPAEKGHLGEHCISNF